MTCCQLVLSYRSKLTRCSVNNARVVIQTHRWSSPADEHRGADMFSVQSTRGDTGMCVDDRQQISAADAMHASACVGGGVGWGTCVIIHT